MSDNIDALPEGTSTPEPALPAELKAVDPEKLAKMRETLKKFQQSAAKTISGSEATADAQPAQPENTGNVTTGKDVDWSEYELDFSVKHLYPQAAFRQTPEGPKWVAMIDEFYSTERDFRNHGKTTDKGEVLNLGNWLNDMLNSPEQWRLVSILPTSGGRAGVLLQRQAPVILPDPTPLKKATEVEAPKDPELQREEDAALEFMGKEGLAPEAGFHSLEQQALTLNPGEPLVVEPNAGPVDGPNGPIVSGAIKAAADMVDALPGSAPVNEEE